MEMIQKNLAAAAAQYGINLAEVIDPNALALRLVAAGMRVTHAAKLCEVGRQYLHKQLKNPLHSPEKRL
jgi:transcriptional regulator of acetoin/glycerol metabolism